MSWLEKDKSQNFHIRFRFGGTKFRRSLRTKDRLSAEVRQRRLDENIRLVESGRLEIPGGCDVAAFLLSDGKLNGQVRAQKRMTLEALIGQFFESLPQGSHEETTLKCIGTHTHHFVRIIGRKKSIDQLSVDCLQNYINKRAKEPGHRGHTVGTNTIRKELATLGTIWQWAVDHKHIVGSFPKRGLRFPKENEKPPFQTWGEIERQIGSSELSKDRQAELWDCLFLSLDQIDNVLDHVKESATQPFV